MPLIAINIMGWFIVSYDKILISDLQGTTALAVYGLAFQLASIYKFGQMGYISALSVNIFESIGNSNFRSNVKEIGKKSAFIFNMTAYIMIFMMYYFSPFLLPDKYLAASGLTILLVISKIMLMYYLFNITLLKSFKNTNYLLILYLLSSVIFYLACKTMIPKYGIMGGIYANIITSAFLMISGQTIVQIKHNYQLKINEVVIFSTVILYAIIAVYFKPIIFHLFSSLWIVSISLWLWTKRNSLILRK